MFSLEFSAFPRPKAMDVAWEIRGPTSSRSFILLEDQPAGDQHYLLHPLNQVTPH
jgi:hypothetical protein